MAELTLAALRVVREIALSGSFTSAGQVLGYSQPAISRQVAAAEAWAGAALFVRRARGVSLSPAGALVAEHAARVLGSVESLENDLARLRDRLAGQLTLGTFPTASSVLVPRAMALLGERHPGLRVLLLEAASPVLVRRVRSARLDAAVIGVGTGLPDYELDELAHEVISEGELCVAVSEDHRLARAGRVALSELSGEAWIVGRRSGADPQFGPWPTLAQPVVRYAVRGWPARLGLVAAGLGVSVLPALAAASVPAGVAVVRVEDPAWLGRATVAISRNDHSGAVSALVTALREVAEEMALV